MPPLLLGSDCMHALDRETEKTLNLQEKLNTKILYLNPEVDSTRVLIFKQDIGGFKISDAVII